MRTRQSQPLEEAAKVLTKETMFHIHNQIKHNYFNHYGIKILDILAYQEPENLKALASRGAIFLMIIKKMQEQMTDILTDYQACQQLANGLVEHEILEMNGMRITLEGATL